MESKELLEMKVNDNKAIVEYCDEKMSELTLRRAEAQGKVEAYQHALEILAKAVKIG